MSQAELNSSKTNPSKSISNKSILSKSQPESLGESFGESLKNSTLNCQTNYETNDFDQTCDNLIAALNHELITCQSESNQAHEFLAQVCNRLHSAQNLLNEYKISTKNKDERIANLEQELELKSQQLETINYDCDELRRRIKSEKHNASQYKAALHRYLDTSQPFVDSGQIVDSGPKFMQAQDIAHTNHENKINPENKIILGNKINPENKINLANQANLTDISNPENSADSFNSYNSEVTFAPELTPEIAAHKSLHHHKAASIAPKDISPEKPKSAAIMLPQFAPLKPR